MIEELVARTFAARNAVHLEHWRTRNYAQHVALGDLYDGLVGKIDGIVEMYQGAFGLLDVKSLDAPEAPAGVLARIADEAAWIQANRVELAGDICAIENALDDLAGLYLTAFYKLKNLS